MRSLIVAAVLTTSLLGCKDSRTIDSLTPVSSNSGKSALQGASAAPTPVEDGQNIFVTNCTGCHGKNADGNTPAGRAYRVPDLHTAQAQSKTDDQMRQIIREGKGKMPAWGGLLSQTDIDHVLAYMRSLKQQ